MNTSSIKRFRGFLLLAVAALGITQLSSRLLPGLFGTWNSQIFDGFFLLRSALPAFKPPYDKTVAHVDLNDTSIRELKTFYPTRSHYGQVMRNLATMQTAAQAYDLIFAAETNPAEDNALINSAKEAGNIFMGTAFALSNAETGRAGRVAPPVEEYLARTMWKIRVNGNPENIYIGEKPLITFPQLASVSRGTGFLSIQEDRDGVIRRVPLLVRYKDGFYPSLPFRVACDYLGVTPDRVTIEPGRRVLLEGARRPGGQPHDISIPIDEHGAMVVNFIGPWETMKHYNFSRIYFASADRDEMEMWTEDLTGKIVVISDVSTGASDIGPVPVDINFPLSGLHANVIHTILSERFLREVPGIYATAIALGLVAILLAMSLHFAPVFFFAGSAALIVCYCASALLLFLTQGLMLEIVRPAIAAALASLLMVGFRYFQDEKEKEALRRSFESYFPPSVVKRIIANPEMINSGQRKELTILFSDIKDFTHYSSTLSPDRIRGCLNEYFETMVDIVFAHKGTVDKYIGDGLMVFFGDPEPIPDHAVKAVQAAIDMQKKAAELSAKWTANGEFPVQIRIGINTGEVVVGNMGSSRRLSYTVLGAAVNMAKRLESNAPVNGILVSERTWELVRDAVPTRSMGLIKVKGIEEPVSTYEILLAEPNAEKLQANSAGGVVSPHPQG